MRYCEYRQVMRQPDEYDVVREIVDWKSTDIAIHNTGNVGTSFGKSFKVTERLANFSCKSVGGISAPLLIPGDGLT